jgi:hypothetical protein
MITVCFWLKGPDKLTPTPHYEFTEAQFNTLAAAFIESASSQMRAARVGVFECGQGDTLRRICVRWDEVAFIG